MENTLDPEVSCWYQDVRSGALLEVFAFDERSATIEYQLAAGSVGKYDLASWKQLLLSPAEPPDAWGSSYEFTADDEAYGDTAMVPENWSGVLAQLEPDLLDLGDDFQVF